MKSGDGVSKGIGACEEALQRLLDGEPFVSAHVGLDLSKLTASIVSLEAGFDRGYLKNLAKHIFQYSQRSRLVVLRLTRVMAHQMIKALNV